MNKFLQGIKTACEGNINALMGKWRTWDGRTASHLIATIERQQGEISGRYCGGVQLEDARYISKKTPEALLWNSEFILALVNIIIGAA